MKATILFLMFLLVTGSWLHAENKGGLEITINSGWSFMDVEKDDNNFCIVCEFFPYGSNITTVNSSPQLGVKAGVYLSDHAEVEGRFSVSPSHNVITDNSFICPPGEICPLGAVPPSYFPFFHLERNMVAYEYGGDFLYHITNGNVRPYGKFGIGAVSSDLDQDTRTDFALQFGGGAKFDFGRYGLRIEVVDQLIPNYFLTQETQNNIQVQYGFVFRP